MVATHHTQSLSDFRQNVDQTFQRVNQTGEAEIITDGGETKAVVLSPSVYQAIQEELQIGRDIEIMRRGMKDIDEGRGRDAGEFFDELEAKLSAMQAQQEAARK